MDKKDIASYNLEELTQEMKTLGEKPFPVSYTHLAIENGQPKDLIILAGKGHETYQEIRGVRYPMDERELIREVMEEWKEEHVR